MTAATSPYAMTRPDGIESTISRTAVTKSGECERTDALAVLGLTDDGEAHAQEELLGPVFAGLPDGGQPLEAAAACLVGERPHRELADTRALGIRSDCHAPDAAAEFGL